MTQDQNMNNPEVITVAPQKKKRKIASLDRKKARAGWFFVLPFLIGFVCLYLPLLFPLLFPNPQNRKKIIIMMINTPHQLPNPSLLF